MNKTDALSKHGKLIEKLNPADRSILGYRLGKPPKMPKGWKPKGRPSYKVTNRELSKSKDFVALCGAKGCKPTKRQASKYRRGLGSVANARS